MLGFSPITTTDTELETSPAHTTLTTPTRKRKGKMPSNQDAYAIKRALTDTEAKKIASAATLHLRTPHPPKSAPPKPRKSTSSPKTSCPSRNPATRKTGIVIHRIALRKDLGKGRRWLEEANKDIGKTTRIRWLRRKTLLLEEGKKTSSAVVYLEKEVQIQRVRLGGKWWKAYRYESERR
ncbi:hypothetical protein BDZ91DRAFT_754035 [Kalaharituber pfeilii]|nr:hypothetical protein BDZ91DRAFT_754035 [Kalaharituber pfeilii]